MSLINRITLIGYANGVFILNSNAIDAVCWYIHIYITKIPCFAALIQQHQSHLCVAYHVTCTFFKQVLSPTELEFKLLGGIIDMFVFTGPDVSTVIEQYQHIIGRPFHVPLWSLGNHPNHPNHPNHLAYNPDNPVSRLSPVSLGL